MNRLARPVVLIPVTLIVLAIFLIAWKGSVSLMSDNFDDYPTCFASLCDHSSGINWHLFIHLDLESCLTCTEDMDSWRAIESDLNQGGGELIMLSFSEDSLDVAEAMRLEEIKAPVNVIDSKIVSDLGWKKLGTPVKVLLDNQCRLVEIEGRMGNVRESAWFFEKIRKHIGINATPSLAAQ